MSLKIVVILTNSVDLDEMSQCDISSESSLFARVPLCRYPECNELIRDIIN